MIFELLDHEKEFLVLLDNLINESTEFEQKILLVDKKLEFINKLIELEKYRLDNRHKETKEENENKLKHRELYDNYLIGSRRDQR